MNLKRLTVAQLRTEFNKAVANTAAGLRRMAVIWVELKERGEDMSAFTNPLLSFLPAVASGKLEPEMLLIYGGRSDVLSKIATLVPEEQKRLASGEGRVQIIDTVKGAARSVRLMDLTIPKLNQIIGDGRIRTPDEQRPHVPAARSTYHKPAARPLDLAPAMAMNQWTKLCDIAEKAGRTPEQQLVWWAVQFRKLPDAPVPVTRETREKLSRALNRTATQHATP